MRYDRRPIIGEGMRSPKGSSSLSLVFFVSFVCVRKLKFAFDEVMSLPNVARGSEVVMLLDFRSVACGFISRPPRSVKCNLGKLFTRTMCL